MSEEKKTAVTEEVKEEVRKLTEEELAQVTGGSKKEDIISIATGMIVEIKTGVDEFVERR